MSSPKITTWIACLAFLYAGIPGLAQEVRHSGTVVGYGNTGSLQAQRNIAHVVYNRKQSSGFPNTYRAVAQQSSQWTTIYNGHENARRPPRTNSHWQDAVIIAKKLVAGTGLPGNLNSTLTKSQLYAKKNGTEPSSAKDIVRVDGTVFYNL